MFGGGLGGVGAIIAGTAVVKMLPDFTGFESQTKKGLDGFSNRASALGGTLTKTLTLPILGIGAAAVKAFGEAESVAAQTDAAIKSTGGAARVTAGDIGEMATTLSRVTAFEDEAIQKSSNLLLTFTKVRNEVGAGNDVFNQSQRAILDMAQAMGGDLQGATLQVGKALNDPIKGVTALGRAGVQFTEQQKDQIKTLVESGRTLDAQKIILAELATQFGGSAEAFAKTGAGQMKQAMNELGNAGESLGRILLPIITAISGVLGNLARMFEGLSPGAQKVVAAFLGIAAAVGPLLLIAAKLATAWTTIVPLISGAFSAISGAFTFLMANPIVVGIAALIAVIYLIVKHWDTIKAFLLATWATIQNVWNSTWQAIKDVAATIWAGIVAVARAIWGAILAYFRFWINAVKAYFAIWGAIGRALVAVWNAIRGAAVAVWNAIKAAITAAVNTVRSIILGVFNGVKNTLAGIWNGIVGAVRSAWNTIKGIIQGAIDAVMGPINALRDAADWLLPGSPVPFVVGLEKSARAMRMLGAEAKRVSLPALGAPRPGELAASAARGAVAAFAGRSGTPQHFHLTTVTRQSLGNVRSDFRLMEAMA